MEQSDEREWHSSLRLIFLGVLAFALVVRVWFLDGRWVNPDEGAHLMNGLLVLEGYVPGVDFPARQPLYGYFLALVLQVGGLSYQAARMYPVLATVAVGGFVYLITARLIDESTAFLAGTLYLFLPFAVAFGTQVKTEPLTILLACAGIYVLLVALDKRPGSLSALIAFAAAGASFALAFYVRQSGLALLLAGLLVIGLLTHGARSRLYSWISLLSGFALICTGAMVGYSTVQPLEAVLRGSLNPLAFSYETIRPLFSSGVEQVSTPLQDMGPSPSGAEVGEGETPEAGPRFDQPWSVTISNLMRTANLNSLLLLGLMLSPFHLYACGAQAPKTLVRPPFRAAVVLFAWLGTIGLAYGLWTVRRGFFPAYFGELLPPLVILTAVVAMDSLRLLHPPDGPGRKDLIVFVGVSTAFVFLHSVFGPLSINRPLYYLAVPAVLALVYLGRRLQWRRLLAMGLMAAAGAVTVFLAGSLGPAIKGVLYFLLLTLAFALLFWGWQLDPRREPARSAGFASYALLFSTCMLWIGVSQSQINREFDGVWSPATVEEVADNISAHTQPGDEVISGAVIWEVQAQRLPFMRLSHPLAFRGGMSPDLLHAVEQRLEIDPPRMVIMDGYTEQTYQASVPAFLTMLEERYHLHAEVGGSRYAVRVYHLIVEP